MVVKEEDFDFKALKAMMVFRSALTSQEDDALSLLAKAAPELKIDVVVWEGKVRKASTMTASEYVSRRRDSTIQAPGVANAGVTRMVLSHLEQQLPDIMRRLHPVTGDSILLRSSDEEDVEYIGMFASKPNGETGCHWDVHHVVGKKLQQLHHSGVKEAKSRAKKGGKTSTTGHWNYFLTDSVVAITGPHSREPVRIFPIQC